MKFARGLADAVLELVFPSGIKCMCCGVPIPRGNSYSLCKNCFKAIRFIKNGCEKCGKPIPVEMHERLCPSCMDEKGALHFDRVQSIVLYRTAIQIDIGMMVSLDEFLTDAKPAFERRDGAGLVDVARLK